MMTYDALSFLLKAVIRFGLYMLLCISIYMLSASLRKKSPVLIVPTFLSVLISGSMFVLYDARSQKSGAAVRGFVRSRSCSRFYFSPQRLCFLLTLPSVKHIFAELSPTVPPSRKALTISRPVFASMPKTAESCWSIIG